MAGSSPIHHDVLDALEQVATALDDGGDACEAERRTLADSETVELPSGAGGEAAAASGDSGEAGTDGVADVTRVRWRWRVLLVLAIALGATTPLWW